MASKEKLELRKQLEKLHQQVRAWSRQDLTAGRWFPQLIEQMLAARAGGVNPTELRKRLKAEELGADAISDRLVSAAIHKALAGTDAYEESFTGTETRILLDKRLDGPAVKLTGDAVPLVAELAMVIRIAIDLIYDLIGAYERQPSEDMQSLATDLIGRATGGVDPAAKDQPGYLEKVGARVFERAIAQSLASPLAVSLRKGYYCYLLKQLRQLVPEETPNLKEWSEPEAPTGAMMAVDDGAALADDGGFQT